MQHIKQLFFSAVAATVLCSSCEKTINVNTPPYAHKLVLNSNSEVGEVLHVSLTKTAAIKDRAHNPDLWVQDAVMKLYVDGVYSETMHTDTVGDYVSLQQMRPGKQYSIKAAEAGYDEISASITIPDVVTITNIVRTPFIRKDRDGKDQDAVTITFSDPPATNDYYIVKIYSVKDSVYYYSSNFCVNSPDPGIETLSDDLAEDNVCLDNNGIFIRDQLFNGKTKELKFYVPSEVIMPQYNGTDSIYGSIELMHVTEAYFRYRKSFKVADESNGDPFAEPANVYSNVTNGFGIFSVSSKDEKRVY